MTAMVYYSPFHPPTNDPGAKGSASFSGSVNNATIILYKRGTSTPAKPTGTATYTFADATLVWAPSNGNDGWTRQIPAGTDPIYVTTAVANEAAPTDIILSAEWANPNLLAFTGQDGEDGTTLVILYQRNSTGVEPAKPTAEATYTVANTSIAWGSPGSPNGWTLAIPDNALGDYLYITTVTITLSGATVTIPAASWSDVVLFTEDGRSYVVSIESTNGTIFRVGQSTQTTLIARVFKNGVDITADIAASKFTWRRVSASPQPYPNDDATWNITYSAGYKQITVSVDDVQARATFFCDINN
jgi:hypothetical protein